MSEPPFQHWAPEHSLLCDSGYTSHPQELLFPASRWPDWVSRAPRHLASGMNRYSESWDLLVTKLNDWLCELWFWLTVQTTALLPSQPQALLLAHLLCPWQAFCVDEKGCPMEDDDKAIPLEPPCFSHHVFSRVAGDLEALELSLTPVPLNSGWLWSIFCNSIMKNHVLKHLVKR